MTKYRFYDEGDNTTLSTIETEIPLTSKMIEMYLDDIEDATGCYVLWEEIG